MIVAQGGSIGGWSLYLKDSKPRYCYNLLGIQRFYVGTDTEVPAGTHQVRMEFDYAGPGLGKGGTVTLYLDSVEIGQGEVAGTAAMIFSADDTCDVGVENGALVAEDYPVPNAFTGEVNWVEIDVGEPLPTRITASTPTSASASRWRGSNSGNLRELGEIAALRWSFRALEAGEALARRCDARQGDVGQRAARVNAEEVALLRLRRRDAAPGDPFAAPTAVVDLVPVHLERPVERAAGGRTPSPAAGARPGMRTGRRSACA